MSGGLLQQTLQTATVGTNALTLIIRAPRTNLCGKALKKDVGVNKLEDMQNEWKIGMNGDFDKSAVGGRHSRSHCSPPHITTIKMKHCNSTQRKLFKPMNCLLSIRPYIYLCMLFS